jgi:transcriptional regulator with XRE-family HTH domain
MSEGKLFMSNPVANVLQGYLEELRTSAEWKAQSKTETVAAEASALGISVGTLSQLRNGKPITDRVIEKIANKIAGGDTARREEVRAELDQARESPNAHASTNNSLEAFHKFLETPTGHKRLVCISYRDVPETRDKGSYPGYIDRSVEVIKNGLACALFQPFGPLKEIKEKTKQAVDEDEESRHRWNYILGLAEGVHEVFEKTKAAVEADGECKGQVVLYEALRVPSLAALTVYSRVCYSHEIWGEEKSNKVRVVQLIKGKDEEYFIECNEDTPFQAAVAAQFYPVLQYWREKGSLPTTQKNIKAYYGEEECHWVFYGESCP